MRRSLLIALPLAFMAVASAFAASAPRPPAATLVFTSDRAAPGSVSPGDIWSVRTDGSGLKRLTRSPRTERAPVWSPDGRRIAFQRQTQVNGNVWHIVVMNADGGGQRVVASGPVYADSGPTWSPDGRRIAYARFADFARGDSDIWVVNADGSGDHALVTDPANADFEPEWSRKGEIVYVREDLETFSNESLVVVSSGGQAARTLYTTSANALLRWPSWSPDGRRVAFTFRRLSDKTSPGDVYVISAAGGTPKRAVRRGQYASWSPDGRWLALSESAGFPAAPAITHALEIVRVDGKAPRTVLLKPQSGVQSDDTDPDWRR